LVEPAAAQHPQDDGEGHATKEARSHHLVARLVGHRLVVLEPKKGREGVALSMARPRLHVGGRPVAASRHPLAQDGACRSHAHDVARALVGTWQEFTITPAGDVLEGELHSSLAANS
jgi:hypothetical protein